MPNFTDSRRDECLLPARKIKRSLDICEDGASADTSFPKMTRKVVPGRGWPPTCRAANSYPRLLQGFPCSPYPPGPSKRAFVGSTSRRHASVDAVTSTVPAVDRVPTAKISVSDNSIGSARARGEKGRTPRTLIHRLAFTRRQARCKRSDDLSRHSRRVWSCGTMNRVKADAVRVLCLKRFLP